MGNLVPSRDIETVTAEINIITVQTQRMLLSGAIEIGRRLVEAKSMVPQGEWGRYLQERVNYSQSSANNLMKLYREYGSNQASLFEDFANSQTFQNLTYTKALAMLALPAELRQSFAEENDVESMSTREVHARVQEELEALRAEKEQTEKKLDEACENNDVLRQRLDDARIAAEDLREDMERAKAKAESIEQEAASYSRDLAKAKEVQAAAEEQVEKLKKQVENAKAKEQKAKNALKQAQEHPEIPESLMEEMRQQVAADAAAKATEDLQKQLAAAQEQAEAATKAKQAAEDAAKAVEEKLAAAEKAAKMKNPDVAVFQSLYIQLQETWNRAMDAYNKVKQTDDGSADSCKRALEAAIAKFRADIG